jgi:hypothetical protein
MSGSLVWNFAGHRCYSTHLTHCKQYGAGHMPRKERIFENILERNIIPTKNIGAMISSKAH